MSKAEFLHGYWLVLYPYLSEKGRIAYRQIREFKTLSALVDRDNG